MEIKWSVGAKISLSKSGKIDIIYFFCIKKFIKNLLKRIVIKSILCNKISRSLTRCKSK